MTSDARPTMRAVTQDAFGGPDVLYETRLPRPAPVPTEILVRVQAAGVNPVDWKTRAGKGAASTLGPPPFVLGWDVAGVVEELGYGVTRFAVGDVVLGMPRFPREAGAYAEYVAAPSRQFARVPAGMSPVEAAALPLAGLTAWQSLVDTAGVQAGQRVLVHAAAGGVGHLAVQIAKARGAHVIGTARAAKHDWLASLGVDEAIDYTAVAFEDVVSGVDVVLDLVGGETGERSLATLRPGGLLISVPSGSASLAEHAAARGVRATGFMVEPDHVGLDALVALVADGALRTEVAEVVGLAEAGRAHAIGEQGRNRGKVVLEV
jgi:NADPH:quinone reductase-like Zn-dependent oxidoreductase